MKAYPSRSGKLPGGNHEERLMKAARNIYHIEQKKAPRRLAYVKSKYFNGQKVFLDDFWMHLKQKPQADRIRRIKFYACALDLIAHSPLAPEVQRNRNKPSQRVYRFSGFSREGLLFFVQIRESKNGRKYFMSVFPN